MTLPLRFGCALLLIIASVAAAGGGATTPATDTDPMRSGAISSLTGPPPFPESSAAARAVFDRLNAAGGVNGRRIDYHVEDANSDPQLAAQAAHRLAEDDGVVANVGSASLLECSVNARYYEKVGLRSIQGIGVDPVCFTAANISPVNHGPF